MAPMSGFERSPIAPLRARAGIFLYEHGGLLFQLPGAARLQGQVQSGLGAALSRLPRRLKLPRIVADVSALVAGGYGRIFHK